MRSFQIMLAPVVLGLATVLGAQEPSRVPSQPRRPAPLRAPLPAGESCETTDDGRVQCERRFVRAMGVDSALMKRGALGLQVNATGSVRDSLGVFVSHVSPKGPAENAGIVEGDRIVSINGVDLRLSAADAADSYTSGLPAHRLSREAAKLTPGSVANVRVYSGGRIRDVRVTAGRASDLMTTRMRSFGFDSDGVPGSSFRFRASPGMMPQMYDIRPGAPGTVPLRIRTFPRTEMLDRARSEIRMLAPSRVPDGRRIRIYREEDGRFFEDTVTLKPSKKRDAEKGAVKARKK